MMRSSDITKLISTTGIGLLPVVAGGMIYSAAFSTPTLRAVGVVIASMGFTLEMIKLSGRIDQHRPSNQVVNALRAYASLYVVFLAMAFPIFFMGVLS